MSVTDELCRSYLDLRWHFDPAAASQIGLTEHDGALGSFETESVGEHLAAFRALEAAIEELEIDDAADEIDRTALLDDVRASIFRIHYESPHTQNPAFWALHLCQALETAGRREVEEGGEGRDAAFARLRGIPNFVEEAEATLELGDAAPPLMETASRLIGEAEALATDLRDRLGGIQADRESEGATQHALDAIAVLQGVIQTHAVGNEVEGTDGGPVGVGTDQFDRLLHHLHAVNAGSAQLWRYLLHAEEEIEQELLALAASDDPNRSWLEQIQDADDTPTSFEMTGCAAAELADLAAFVGDRGLVPLPDLPSVRPLSGYLEPMQGLATYWPPAWRGEDRRAWIELGPWPSMRKWLSPLLVELGIPGLHLHEAAAGRLRPEVRRNLESRLTRGGWGLYAVRLMDESGYWTTDRGRLIARSYLLLRIVLARVDVAIHTHQMTVEGAAALLEDRLALEPPHASGLAMGCLLQPTEALGAIVGRRELLRLREDCRLRDGPGFSLPEFHEQVLSYGGLPIPLVRWGMGFED